MSERRWSAQFIGMLEALRMPTQFQQGRRYARAGHVRQLTISTGLASALVLDEDGQTYRARIAVRAFSGGDWNRIERALAQRAVYAAKLLGGQLPADLDELLAQFGLSLFPDGLDDLAMACPCPDWHVPCRHLAAACYALAESFDTDPFGILAWRGRGRVDLLDRLRALRVEPTPIVTTPTPAPAPVIAGFGGADQRSNFWTAGPRVAPPLDQVPAAVRRPDALLDQLDQLPLTAGRYVVVDLLRSAYQTIAQIRPQWSIGGATYADGMTRVDPVVKIRAFCMALPEVTERLSHGTPNWFVRDKSTFVTLWPNGHHDHQFPHLWCAAPPGGQAELIAANPERFFRPPYVGHRGWLGVRLDGDIDWTEIGELCEDAYRAVAPKRLILLLDEPLT